MIATLHERVGINMTAELAGPTAALTVVPGAGTRHEGASGGWVRRNGVTAALVFTAVVLGVLGPLLLSVHTGSISIPHNDTWAFSRTTQIFARTGHIVLFNWNAMSLVGIVVVLAPIGASITVQNYFIAVLALAALAAIFDLLRAYCGPRRAALGLVIVASWPGFGLLSTSLMTDIPALAAMAVTLCLGRRALERGSFPLLALAAIVGFWGFSVREQAIAAPLGVFAAALLRPEYRTRASVSRLAAILLPLCAIAAGFELWRRGLPRGEDPFFGRGGFPGVGNVLMSVLSGWLLLGLILSPLVFLVARPRSWRLGERLVAGSALLVLAGAAFGFQLVLPQNFISLVGSYPVAFLGSRTHVIPQTVWDVLTPLGCISGALLAGVLVERVRRLRPEFALFTLFMFAGTLLEVVEGQGLFDRYILPLALPVIASLLSEPLRGPGMTARPLFARKAVGGTAGLVVVGVTGLLTANALTFDAATWHAAQRIVASGKASAAYVDAGLAWTGYYSPHGMALHGDLNAEGGVQAFTPRLGHDQPCYIVAASPQNWTDWHLIAEPKYRIYGLLGREQHLYVYRTKRSVCG
jgi:hypothetical protein